MFLLLWCVFVFSSAAEAQEDRELEAWRKEHLGFLSPVEMMHCKDGNLPLVDSTGQYIAVQTFISQLRDLKLREFEKGACTIVFEPENGQPTKITLGWTVLTDLKDKIYCKYTECTSSIENIAMSLTKVLAPYNPEITPSFKAKIRQLRGDLFKVMKLVDGQGYSEIDMNEETHKQLKKLSVSNTTKEERLLGTMETKAPKVQKLALLANVWLFEAKISNPVRSFIQTASMGLIFALCFFMVFIACGTRTCLKNARRAQE